MKWIFRKLIFLACILLPAFSLAQDVNAHSPSPNSGSRQQRAADKKKAKQQKKADLAIEKGKERHLKLQAKNTRRMMRKSKRTAKRWNEDKREFFLKRWFRKDHH